MERSAEALRPHEALALHMLLSGEDPLLLKLRLQAREVQVAGRKHTGVGEYVDLSVPDESEPVQPSRLVLADVNFSVAGTKHGADVLLFVVDGKLRFIEFATAADEWPTDPVVSGSTYYREVETAPGSYALEPCVERDAATLARALLGAQNSAA